MKRLSVVLSVLVLSVLLLSACAPAVSVPAAANAPVRQMMVTGKGQVYVTPDLAYIYVGVHSENTDVSAALDDNNSQAKAIAATLQDMGVEAKDIQTSSFNIYPMDYYGPYGQTSPDQKPEKRYVVDNTVFVTVRDLQNLGKVLDAVVKSGANSINGINFDISDPQKASEEARKLAIDNAKEQAQKIAQDAGIELGDLITLNAYSASTPYYEGKGGYGGGMMAVASEVPTSAGQMTITVTADLTYEIK